MFSLFSKANAEPGSIRNLGSLRNWLDDLPPLDLHRSISHMSEALQETENLSLPVRKMLPMLHAFRSKIRQIVEPSYSVPPASEATSARLDTLLKALSEAYRVGFDGPDAKLNPGCEFCTAIYCAMELQVHRLLLAYRGYGTPPWGGHHKVHELMQLAENARVLYQPVAIGDETAASESVGKLYKQYLLLTLADPYHVGNGEIYTLFQLLARYVQDLALLRDPRELSDDTLFGIDQASDCVAVPAARLKKPVATPLFLDLSKVVSSISRDRINEDASPTNRRYFETGRRLLEQILPRFKADQKRRESRKANTGPVAVVCGYKNLHHAISHQTPITLPDATQHGLEVVMDDKPQSASVETWQILNQSGSGLCLSCHGRINRIRVGDLVGLGENAGWSGTRIGLIRWMRRQDNDLIHLGVELLAGDVTACRFKQGGAGILLKPQRKPLIILALKNQLASGESHDLRSKKPFVLRTNKVLLRTSYLDGLSCELRASA